MSDNLSIPADKDEEIAVLKESYRLLKEENERLRATVEEKPVFGEWQLCPKCGGQGTVSKPPYIPGDINQWSSSAMSHVCDVCNGAKTIMRPIIPSSK